MQLEQASSSSSSAMSSSKSCDTLPAPQNLLARPYQFDSQPTNLERPLSEPFDTPFDDGSVEDKMHSLNVETTSETASATQPPPSVPARKLCVRHQRMADEGISGQVQQVSSEIR